MADTAIEKAVLAYLKRKGYKNSELAFKDESLAEKSDAARGRESDQDQALANQIMLYSRHEKPPECYVEGYKKLRSWVHSSLDLYKNELLRILYPVFLHCFLELVQQGFEAKAREFFDSYQKGHQRLHAHDLKQIAGITSPLHVQENQVANLLLQNKMPISLCQYSFELLLKFLHSSHLMAILAIVNRHVAVTVRPGQPSPQEEEEDSLAGEGEEIVGPPFGGVAAGAGAGSSAKGGKAGTDKGGREALLLGARQPTVQKTSEKAVLWGALEDSVEARFEREKEREADGAREGGGDEAKDGKVKKEGKESKDGAAAAATVDGGAGKGGKAGGPVRPVLAMPQMMETVEASIFDDLRKRVTLGPRALPSVCCYTFLHAQTSLTAACHSSDSSLLAAGFADTSVKVWDIRRIGTEDLHSSPDSNVARDAKRVKAEPSAASALPVTAGGESRAAEGSTGDSEGRGGVAGGSGGDGDGSGVGPSECGVVLRGHAGPVYGLSFNPMDERMLLSCSGDATVRLWHLDVGSCLVAYRGHGFPVWDVQYSPFGQYFVSASHDRTARLWTTERSHSLRIFAGHLTDVHAACWHANGNYVATASGDKTLRLWDIQSGDSCRMFIGHRSPAISIAASPCGRFLASGDSSGAVLLWDLSSARCIAPLLAHTGPVWTLAFSADGSLLASGSADETVQLWDVTAAAKQTKAETKVSATRRLRLLKTLATRATPISALKFTRRNLLLAAGARKDQHQ